MPTTTFDTKQIDIVDTQDDKDPISAILEQYDRYKKDNDVAVKLINDKVDAMIKLLNNLVDNSATTKELDRLKADIKGINIPEQKDVPWDDIKKIVDDSVRKAVGEALGTSTQKETTTKTTKSGGDKS